RASAGDHARATRGAGRAARAGRCGRRDRGNRPRRQVDLPRAGAAHLLSDRRPAAARAGRQTLLPRPRRGLDQDLGAARGGSDADRRADGDLARGPAAEDRVDWNPYLEVGDDARLRAQRRSRPGAVHGLDHGVRARGRGVHDDRARARAAGFSGRGAAARGGSVGGGLRSLVRGAPGRGTTGPLAATGPCADSRRPLAVSAVSVGVRRAPAYPHPRIQAATGPGRGQTVTHPARTPRPFQPCPGTVPGHGPPEWPARPGWSDSYTRRVSTNRLETFADGVFAIAATLLILNVDAQVSERSGAVGQRLLAIWPSYIAYAVSFVTIGIIWSNHHTVMAQLGRVDRTFMMQNVLLL